MILVKRRSALLCFSVAWGAIYYIFIYFLLYVIRNDKCLARFYIKLRICVVGFYCELSYIDNCKIVVVFEDISYSSVDLYSVGRGRTVFFLINFRLK